MKTSQNHRDLGNFFCWRWLSKLTKEKKHMALRQYVAAPQFRGKPTPIITTMSTRE